MRPNRFCPFFQQRDVAAENGFGIGKGFGGFGDAVFPNQVQGWIGAAVGVVADVVGLRALEAEIGMEGGDLDDTLQAVVDNGLIGEIEHVVKLHEVGKQ